MDKLYQAFVFHIYTPLPQLRKHPISDFGTFLRSAHTVPSAYAGIFRFFT